MQKELSKIPKVAEVRGLVKMPCFYDLKNKIMYGREGVGKKDFLVFLHIVTETAYEEGGSLHKAGVPIISENSFLIKELAKVRKEIKTDLVNLAVMQPIMENLPKEALWVKFGSFRGLKLYKRWRRRAQNRTRGTYGFP